MRTVVLSIAMLWLGCSESEEGLAPGTVPLSEYVPTDRNQEGTPTGGSSEGEGSREREREQRTTVSAGAGSEAPEGPENLAGDEAVVALAETQADTSAEDETSDEEITLTPPGTSVEEGAGDRPADALEDCTGSDDYSRCVIQRFDEGRSARSCGQVQAVYSAYRDLGNTGAADRMLATRDQACGGAGEGGGGE